ncbi:MAG: hypothetical protein IPK16_30870 [Anaerolineales bacterium]|nr:hypothetical protein [Anaerolineales bacterium]
MTHADRNSLALQLQNVPYFAGLDAAALGELADLVIDRGFGGLGRLSRILNSSA